MTIMNVQKNVDDQLKTLYQYALHVLHEEKCKQHTQHRYVACTILCVVGLIVAAWFWISYSDISIAIVFLFMVIAVSVLGFAWIFNHTLAEKKARTIVKAIMCRCRTQHTNNVDYYKVFYRNAFPYEITYLLRTAGIDYDIWPSAWKQWWRLENHELYQLPYIGELEEEEQKTTEDKKV